MGLRGCSKRRESPFGLPAEPSGEASKDFDCELPGQRFPAMRRFSLRPCNRRAADVAISGI
jgi:hypothetical protein